MSESSSEESSEVSSLSDSESSSGENEDTSHDDSSSESSSSSSSNSAKVSGAEDSEHSFGGKEPEVDLTPQRNDWVGNQEINSKKRVQYHVFRKNDEKAVTLYTEKGEAILEKYSGLQLVRKSDAWDDVMGPFQKINVRPKGKNQNWRSGVYLGSYRKILGRSSYYVQIFTKKSGSQIVPAAQVKPAPGDITEDKSKEVIAAAADKTTELCFIMSISPAQPTQVNPTKPVLQSRKNKKRSGNTDKTSPINTQIHDPHEVVHEGFRCNDCDAEPITGPINV